MPGGRVESPLRVGGWIGHVSVQTCPGRACCAGWLLGPCPVPTPRTVAAAASAINPRRFAVSTISPVRLVVRIVFIRGSFAAAGFMESTLRRSKRRVCRAPDCRNVSALT